MGVSSTTNRVTLVGNGVSTSFAFPYYFFRQADLIVYIYDTLLGGITGPYILNTDYTITGSVNYQGLYASGGAVVFSSYVPLVTDKVIITRAPIQQQNYALLQGGTIPSAATVQQFDYLTLLIQRLQDEVSRCVQLPDGMGSPFTNTLPANIALSAGFSPLVNPTGNGWVLGIPGAGASQVKVITNGGNTNYNVMPTDQYVRSGTAFSAPRTWTLPPALTVGQELFVKHLASQGFNLTLAANGTDLIDAAATSVMIPGYSLSLICGQPGQWDIF